MYEQLVQPDLSVVGRLTWCLEYARKVFKAPVVEPTAWKAWEATKYKHDHKNFPNVAVPVWFSYTDTLNGVTQNWGHVAVRLPNGQIYSSPMQSGKSNAVFNSVEALDKFLGSKYVGWSEDISNVRVAIKKDEEPMFNEGDRKNWLAEAYVEDVGQYKDLVGKATFKDAVERMRGDLIFRANAGDVMNEFIAFGLTATAEDLANWSGQQHKKIMYEKWMKQGLVQGGKDNEFKPYSGETLYIKEK